MAVTLEVKLGDVDVMLAVEGSSSVCPSRGLADGRSDRSAELSQRPGGAGRSGAVRLVTADPSTRTVLALPGDQRLTGQMLIFWVVGLVGLVRW